MPVSDILARPQPPLPHGIERPTNQQIADLALEADQRARRLHREGYHTDACIVEAERDALCGQLS